MTIFVYAESKVPDFFLFLKPFRTHWNTYLPYVRFFLINPPSSRTISTGRFMPLDAVSENPRGGKFFWCQCHPLSGGTSLQKSLHFLVHVKNKIKRDKISENTGENRKKCPKNLEIDFKVAQNRWEKFEGGKEMISSPQTFLIGFGPIWNQFLNFFGSIFFYF